jgi:hypothetical protein
MTVAVPADTTKSCWAWGTGKAVGAWDARASMNEADRARRGPLGPLHQGLGLIARPHRHHRSLARQALLIQGHEPRHTGLPQFSKDLGRRPMR